MCVDTGASTPYIVRFSFRVFFFSLSFNIWNVDFLLSEKSSSLYLTHYNILVPALFQLLSPVCVAPYSIHVDLLVNTQNSCKFTVDNEFYVYVVYFNEREHEEKALIVFIYVYTHTRSEYFGAHFSHTFAAHNSSFCRLFHILSSVCMSVFIVRRRFLV